MTKAVLLDAGTLGILAHDNPSARGRACQRWAVDLRRKGLTFFIPALADYEVRRGLELHGSVKSLEVLDSLIERYVYLPPTVAAIRHASTLWVAARKRGRLPGRDTDLNPDILLAGQALELQAEGYDAWVATDNLKHVQDLYANSALWETITP